MSDPVNGIPPWPLATRTDGSLDILGIPGWLRHHPELERRGLVLNNTLKPFYVFATDFRDSTVPAYAVKILLPDSEEAAIYKRLEGSKHLLPFELIETESPSLLLMPYLPFYFQATMVARTLSDLLGVFLQLVEAVEHLHNNHIAHLDLSLTNALVAHDLAVKHDRRLVEGRIYLIDYHTSRQFNYGPGVEHAVCLPCTQERLPMGLKSFDPYAWDVYCLGSIWGKTIQGLFSSGQRPPRIAAWIERWLVGKERGCATTCHCRPTIRRARRVLTALRGIIWVVERCLDAFNPALIQLRD